MGIFTKFDHPSFMLLKHIRRVVWNNSADGLVPAWTLSDFNVCQIYCGWKKVVD